MNSNSSNTTSGALLRPGEALQQLGGRKRSSKKTEYLAAKKLRTIGVPLLQIGNSWWVPRVALEAWLTNPACAAAAAAAQESRRRGPGRPSNAARAMRAAAAGGEVRHGY